MASAAGLYFAAMVLGAERPWNPGDLQEPQKRFSTPDTWRVLDQRIVIPAGTSVKLYDAQDENLDGFNALLFHLPKDSEGFLYICTVHDTPTSTTNLTPTGTNERMNVEGLSCNGFCLFSTAISKLHTTLATHNARTGAVAGAVPAVLASATASRLYEVWARNDEAEDITIVKHGIY